MAESFRKALVTGGAGFIGSHLSRRLLREGLEVVVLDNLSTGVRANVPPGATFLEGDLLDPNTVARALDGVDIVFHNAARVSVRASIEHFLEDAQTNIMGTLTLLRELRDTKVRKLVLASSMAVYADSPDAKPLPETFPQRPLSPYGAGKLAAEHYALLMCATLGIDVVPLRYFNTYGPGQAFTPYVGVVTIFATKLLNGERPTIFGEGTQVRDFVSVHDIVEGNICAMRAPVTGEVFNTGSGQGTTVKRVAELLVEKIAPHLEPAYAPEQAGEIRNSVADITRARDLLGYRPQGSFERDIDEIIETIRARLARPAA
jgi:UDP-glucose 4-epimerase